MLQYEFEVGDERRSTASKEGTRDRSTPTGPMGLLIVNPNWIFVNKSVRPFRKVRLAFVSFA